MTARLGQSTRPRRAFELKTRFAWHRTHYSWFLQSWRATVYPRMWNGRIWETIVDDDATFEVHELASANPDYIRPYSQGRPRDWAKDWTPPHNRGSYGWAELSQEANLWELIWLEPAAQIIWGKRVYVYPFDYHYIGLEAPVRVVYPPGGLICDQDPAGTPQLPWSSIPVIVGYWSEYLTLPNGTPVLNTECLGPDKHTLAIWAGSWWALWASGE